MGNLLGMKIGRQLVDILAQLQNQLKLRFGDVQHHHMHLAAVFREMGRNLGADEGSRQMSDFQGTVDGVMVGDGDEVHATFPGSAVEMPGRCVALRDIELAHGPVGRFVGMAGVDMQICFV